MANSTIQNKKVISLALGAVADGAYLYAGADRAIASEMQGKDNGDVIYYKTTNLGQAEISDVSMGNPANTGLASLDIAAATPIKHRQVPVKIKDARIMYNVKALEKQITSLGEDLATAKVGQKLAKKAKTSPQSATCLSARISQPSRRPAHSSRHSSTAPSTASWTGTSGAT